MGTSAIEVRHRIVQWEVHLQTFLHGNFANLMYLQYSCNDILLAMYANCTKLKQYQLQCTCKNIAIRYDLQFAMHIELQILQLPENCKGCQTTKKNIHKRQKYVVVNNHKGSCAHDHPKRSTPIAMTTSIMEKGKQVAPHETPRKEEDAP